MCTYISTYSYVTYVGTICLHTYAYSCIYTHIHTHTYRCTPIKLNAQLISILFLMNFAGSAQIVATPTHTTTWRLYYTIRKSGNEHNIFVINLVARRHSHGKDSIWNRRGGDVYSLICRWRLTGLQLETKINGNYIYYICFCNNKGKAGEYEIKVGNYAPRFSWPQMNKWNVEIIHNYRSGRAHENSVDCQPLKFLVYLCRCQRQCTNVQLKIQLLAGAQTKTAGVRVAAQRRRRESERVRRRGWRAKETALVSAGNMASINAARYNWPRNIYCVR